MEKIAALGVVFLMAAWPLQAQVDSCQTRSLPITVRDSHGLSLGKFVPQDFIAKSNKKPVAIASVSADTRPRRFVILVDSSGSMGGEKENRRWRLAFELAGQVARTLGPSARLALLRFDEQVHEVIDFSAGDAAVYHYLQQVMDGQTLSSKDMHGRTSLYDAAYRGWQLLDHPSSADLLFAITDGGDNNSRMKREALERVLINSGVRFCSVLKMDKTISSRGQTLEELEGPSIVQELAALTGGEVFGPVGFRRGGYLYFESSNYRYGDKTPVEEALLRFDQGLVQGEVMQIALPVASPKEDSLEIKFTDEARRKWKNATLTYPRKLPACSTLAKR